MTMDVARRRPRALSTPIAQYAIVTGNYWAFTLTDGALRMLVVLHFHSLGYSPLEIALLFLFYEIFGVVTNLFGGWIGARLGLNRTMNAGLALQVVALSMLLVPGNLLVVPWVMAAQALSGIAKDLNNMANALGRPLGTVLSGWLFQAYGLGICLWVSAAFVAFSAVIVTGLPPARSAPIDVHRAEGSVR